MPIPLINERNDMNSIDHSERKHTKLSASKIGTLALCPGKLNAEAAFPPEPAGEAALRGTAVHETSELIFAGMQIPEDTPDDIVQEARAYVDAVMQRTEKSKKRFIELNVTEALRDIHPDLGGMSDMVAIGNGELLIADLKTGRIQIEPDSPQNKTYALGAALTLNAPKDIKVKLAVYQQGWRETEISYDELMDWREELVRIAKNATDPNAPRIAGDEQCRYCRARSTCSTLHEKAISVAKSEFTRIDAQTIEDAKLCQVFAESVLSKAVEQLQAEPSSIAGWKLREGRRMVSWKDRAMAEAILANNMDAWELKSASAVQKLGVTLPDGIVEEKRSAPSLVKAKE